MAYPNDNEYTEASGLHLTLANGATWNVTNVSDSYTDEEAKDVVKKLAVTDLTSDGGVINLSEGGTAAINGIDLDEGGLTVNVEDEGGCLEYTSMAGEGGLTKTGDGTLTLSSDTEYAGTTTVEGRTLDVGSIEMASDSLTIYSGATFSTDTDREFTSLSVNAAEGGTATYDGNLSVTDGTITFITSVSPDEPLLTVTGNADVSGSSYVVGVYGGTELAEGTTLTLLTSEGRSPPTAFPKAPRQAR